MTALLKHPTWSKVAAGIICALVTSSTGLAISTRDQVLEDSRRIGRLEEQMVELSKTLPQIREDVAVLRDRSDREFEKNHR